MGTTDERLSFRWCGNTVLLGTPCDFSGEFVADFKPLIAKQGVNLMITSFDGGYIGYVTPDRYYDRATYETRDTRGSV